MSEFNPEKFMSEISEDIFFELKKDEPLFFSL